MGNAMPSKDGIEECPSCGRDGVVPYDGVRDRETYRQCKNKDCRVRLYTPYPEFWGGERDE